MGDTARQFNGQSSGCTGLAPAPCRACSARAAGAELARMQVMSSKQACPVEQQGQAVQWLCKQGRICAAVPVGPGTATPPHCPAAALPAALLPLFTSCCCSCLLHAVHQAALPPVLQVSRGLQEQQALAHQVLVESHAAAGGVGQGQRAV